MDHDLNAFATLQVPSAGAGGRGSWQNIMGDQRRALAILKRSENIIVKPANKGGQIVLQDRIDYLFEANRQLEDSNYYRPLQQSMQPETWFSQAQESCEPLHHFKLITANRRNRNLKDTLVHTALDRKKVDSDPWLLHYLPFIFNEASVRGFLSRHKIGAQSFNIVYAIPCEHCGKLYIGETGKALKTRITEDLNYIKNGNTGRILYAHFVQFSLEHFKWIGIESNPLSSTKL